MELLNFIIHIDEYLVILLQNYGNLIYPILFFIIFSETGLVVTPFLPGDSLLFALGALAFEGQLNIIALGIMLIIAAFLGNTTNYLIGKHFGHFILHSENKILRKIIKEEYIKDTHDFFEKHGGKAVIFSRFFPILRTFAPFVAGIGEMTAYKYSSYNIIGGTLWVTLVLTLGYLFGTIPFVKNNFSYIMIGIVLISLLPVVLTIIKTKLKKA